MTAVNMTELRWKILDYLRLNGPKSQADIGNLFSPNPHPESRTRWAEGAMKSIEMLGWVIGRRPAHSEFLYTITEAGISALSSTPLRKAKRTNKSTTTSRHHHRTNKR